MLRRLTVAAPVIAAMMIVVLLVEPPALRPAERIPTLRVFTTRTEASLDREGIQAAIARGQDGEPESYVLRQIRSAGDRRSTAATAGLVYTPYLRIAWAAHTRQQVGRPLTVDDVPGWMTAPVVYVALRRPETDGGDELGVPSLAVLPRGSASCCQLPQPTLIRPIWVTPDVAPIVRFGAPLPFTDLGVVAAYPLDALQADLDIVAYHRIDRPAGPVSLEMRGRIEPDDVSAWR